MYLSTKVKQIAKETRKFFERVAKEEGFSKDLRCLCYRASFSLVKRLQAKGIKAKVVQGKMLDTSEWPATHAWVEYKDKIIDTTATQFGYRNKVFIRPLGCKLYTARAKTQRGPVWPPRQRSRKSDYAI